MLTTSQSLLERLQRQIDSQAWQRLVTVYEPWLRGWLGRHEIQSSDADDVLQNILLVISQKLPMFSHIGRPGAFRAWLRSILVNQVRYSLRTQRQRRDRVVELSSEWLDQLEDPASGISQEWDQEHDQQVVRRLLAAVQGEFEPQTWEVFRLLVLENRQAVEVARTCRMQRNAVYVAKSRVLARLRQELRGLVDS